MDKKIRKVLKKLLKANKGETTQELNGGVYLVRVHFDGLFLNYSQSYGQFEYVEIEYFDGTTISSFSKKKLLKELKSLL